MRRIAVLTLLGLALPAALLAAPQSTGPRPDPREGPRLAGPLRQVQPAIVGIEVQVPRHRPSAVTLGTRRWGSAVIFDPAGYALTVSYLLLDADTITVRLPDGRQVPGRLVGIDLEAGLGVVQLQGPAPWPTARLADSRAVAVGAWAGTLGVEEDGELVGTVGQVEAIRPYTAPWEYALDRAFIVTPYNRAFGGGAVVDATGAVVGIASLRLGERPFVNLAIPVETFLPGKDELIATGRLQSRRPRPWLGLYALPREDGGVVVGGVMPVGPAAAAGVRRGDVIVRMNGEKVAAPEDFYARLWQGQVGEDVELVVVREGRFEALSVRSADRYRFYRTTEK
jgi:S1-C subfamily serine protease